LLFGHPRHKYRGSSDSKEVQVKQLTSINWDKTVSLLQYLHSLSIAILSPKLVHSYWREQKNEVLVIYLHYVWPFTRLKANVSQWQLFSIPAVRSRRPSQVTSFSFQQTQPLQYFIAIIYCQPLLSKTLILACIQ